MSTSITAPAPPSRKRKRGPYSYSKCKNCRKDKKKCEPIERPADQPCHRCQEKRLQCSPQEDLRKNDTTPEPSLSDPNSVVTPDLKDPVIQCLHLVNWYNMVPDDVPIKRPFSKAIYNIVMKTIKNVTDGDARGTALLCSLTSLMDINDDPTGHLELKVMLLGPIVQSESSHRSRLELSRLLWDAGDTSSSLGIFIGLLLTDRFKEPFEDPGEGLNLQIVRQYIRFLKCFWDINRQLWKIHHAQLASQVPQLQGYIETCWHIDLASLPSTVFDLILDEYPPHCTSPDSEGDTLLHTAARSLPIPSDRLQNVQKLLDRGIDANHKNHEGQTALHILCGGLFLENDDIPFLKLMIQHKEIDINARNKNGETALHLLCGRRYPKSDDIPFLKLMIQHKEIDINARNKNGETALHVLCRRDSGRDTSMDMLEHLLEHQAINVGIRDERGRIPADCLPQASTAELFEKYPFLWRLFRPSSLADRPQGTTAGQDSSTYGPLPPVYNGAYIPAPIPHEPLMDSHLAALEANALR